MEAEGCNISSHDLDTMLLALKKFVEYKNCKELNSKLTEWATCYNAQLKRFELKNLLKKFVSSSRNTDAESAVPFPGSRALELLPKAVKPTAEMQDLAIALPFLMRKVLRQAKGFHDQWAGSLFFLVRVSRQSWSNT